MGRAILNGASSFVSGLGNIAMYPIQLAFAYWMRCSEFSADRAAIICDGTAEENPHRQGKAVPALCLLAH